MQQTLLFVLLTRIQEHLPWIFWTVWYLFSARVLHTKKWVLLQHFVSSANDLLKYKLMFLCIKRTSHRDAWPVMNDFIICLKCGVYLSLFSYVTPVSSWLVVIMPTDPFFMFSALVGTRNCCVTIFHGNCWTTSGSGQCAASVPYAEFYSRYAVHCRMHFVV